MRPGSSTTLYQDQGLCRILALQKRSRWEAGSTSWILPSRWKTRISGTAPVAASAVAAAPAAASLSTGTTAQRQVQLSPTTISLLAGAASGMSVEAILFPIDSLKTRLQSGTCFREAGAFRSIYRGVGVTAVGAVPASAIFFCTYEYSKERFGSVLFASVAGELVASSIRVPVDLVKQRLQVGLSSGMRSAVRDLIATPASVVFASYRISAVRDMTHSGLQYPAYEHLKCWLARRNGLRSPEELPVLQSAACGSAAGASSAFVTTPLDVVRTRLNLRPADAAVSNSGGSPLLEEAMNLLRSSRQRGIGVLFAGAACRATWMGLGGFVFLGSFELAKRQLQAFPAEAPAPKPQLEPAHLQPPTQPSRLAANRRQHGDNVPERQRSSLRA